MSPTDRDRFEKCLALAERGVTIGERAAALAAAERIAATANMTFAEAKAEMRSSQPAATEAAPSRPSSFRSRRSYAWAQPKAPPEPVTIEELLRQKAEAEARRKRLTEAADRERVKVYAEEEAYQAEQRARQVERDQEWAAQRTGSRA